MWVCGRLGSGEGSSKAGGGGGGISSIMDGLADGGRGEPWASPGRGCSHVIMELIGGGCRRAEEARVRSGQGRFSHSLKCLGAGPACVMLWV